MSDNVYSQFEIKTRDSVTEVVTPTAINLGDISVETLAASAVTQKLHSTVTVADAYGSAIIWTTGDCGISTFTAGVLVANQDIFVEFKNNKSTPEYSTMKVPANLPCSFGGYSGGVTTAVLDGAVLVAGTDYGTITQIEVQRNTAEGTGDVVVDLIMW